MPSMVAMFQSLFAFQANLKNKDQLNPKHVSEWDLN